MSSVDGAGAASGGRRRGRRRRRARSRRRRRRLEHLRPGRAGCRSSATRGPSRRTSPSCRRRRPPRRRSTLLPFVRRVSSAANDQSGIGRRRDDEDLHAVAVGSAVADRSMSSGGRDRGLGGSAAARVERAGHRVERVARRGSASALVACGRGRRQAPPAGATRAAAPTSCLSSAPRLAPTSCMIALRVEERRDRDEQRGSTAQKWRLRSWSMRHGDRMRREMRPRHLRGACHARNRWISRRFPGAATSRFARLARPASAGRPQRDKVTNGSSARSTGAAHSGDAVELAVDGARRDAEELRGERLVALACGAASRGSRGARSRRAACRSRT